MHNRQVAHAKMSTSVSIASNWSLVVTTSLFYGRDGMALAFNSIIPVTPAAGRGDSVRWPAAEANPSAPRCVSLLRHYKVIVKSRYDGVILALTYKDS